MITRREALQVAAAAAVYGIADFPRAMAQQRLTQEQLLSFDHFGNITLLHTADLHGQLTPVYVREPSLNIGVGEGRGQPPHLTDGDFLKRFGIAPRSASASPAGRRRRPPGNARRAGEPR